MIMKGSAEFIHKKWKYNKSVPSQFATKQTLYPKWKWYKSGVVDQWEHPLNR